MTEFSDACNACIPRPRMGLCRDTVPAFERKKVWDFFFTILPFFLQRELPASPSSFFHTWIPLHVRIHWQNCVHFCVWHTHIPFALFFCMDNLHPSDSSSPAQLGLCFSQTILTTSFKVCFLRVAAISIFPTLTCFLLNLLFHHPEPWQCMQERRTPSAAESPGKEKVLARAGCQYSPQNILCILKSSSSGLSFPMLLWPRGIPALWDGRSGSASASVIWSGSTGRGVKSLRQGLLWGNLRWE